MLKRFSLFGLSFAASLVAASASAATYSCPNPNPPWLTGSPSSLVSAAAMSAHCFGRGYTAPSSDDWNRSARASYTAQCAGSGSGVGDCRPLGGCSCNPTGVSWPEGCNPTGAAAMLNSRASSQHWLQYIAPNTATNMGQVLMDKMRTYNTPLLLPLHGSWRHWVALTRVDTKMMSGTESFFTVKFSDGLAPGADDGTGHFSYGASYTIQNAVAFVGNYYTVVGFPGASCYDDMSYSCSDAPLNDPWFFRWVFLYEPPAGMGLLGGHGDGPLLPVARAPGLVSAGQPMTAAIAVNGARQALRLAGLDEDPQVRRVMENGIFDQASLVRGRVASGQPWDYYLLPVHSESGRVTAFLQLSATDGSFDTLYALNRPIEQSQLDEVAARSEASRFLGKGEQLGAAVLTWQPEVQGGLNDFSYLPWYEFEVRGPGEKARGLVRVARHDASQSRRDKAARE